MLAGKFELRAFELRTLDVNSMKYLTILALALAAASCNGATPATGRATPVYDQQTGKLAQLISDRNGDGKIDMRAQMDGVRFKSVEIDRNGDGKPDRWEYYDTVPGPRGVSESV